MKTINQGLNFLTQNILTHFNNISRLRAPYRSIFVQRVTLSQAVFPFLFCLLEKFISIIFV